MMEIEKLIDLIKDNEQKFYIERSSVGVLLTADIGEYIIEIEGEYGTKPEPGFYDEDEMGRSSYTPGSDNYSLVSISEIGVYDHNLEDDLDLSPLSVSQTRDICNVFNWYEFNTYQQ